MRRLVVVLAVLPLVAAQAPLDAPRIATEPLVPVTRMDSPLASVRSATLAAVIVPTAFGASVRELLPNAHVVAVTDPIARARQTGEIALVPPRLVSTAVKTLDLDGRSFWRDRDVAHWPLRVRTSADATRVGATGTTRAMGATATTGATDAGATDAGATEPAGATPSGNTWTVLAAGEIIFGRGVQERIENRFRGDARAAFASVRDTLRAADLTVATLEAPLSGNANRYCDDCMKFVGNERYAPALADAGIDVVSLGANHIGDAGPSGVISTIRALDAANVAHVGAAANAESARQALTMTVAGHRVAILGYDGVSGPWYGATRTVAGSNPLSFDDPTFARARMDVARASLDADVVIVLAHWGIEYEDAPRPEVVAAAHAMVEAGATAVIGDHPHWVQSIERYRGAYIAYGVGNFVFDQMWSDETRQGSIHELTFWGDRLVGVRILPTVIEDYYRPRLLRPDEPAYRTVLERVWRHSVL
jgi:poly-gamma-glutamate capsule biosynthesis protein CapA/YwtB (metallophosphatase superfamily)